MRAHTLGERVRTVFWEIRGSTSVVVSMAKRTWNQFIPRGACADQDSTCEERSQLCSRSRKAETPELAGYTPVVRKTTNQPTNCDDPWSQRCPLCRSLLCSRSQKAETPELAGYTPVVRNTIHQPTNWDDPRSQRSLLCSEHS